MAKHLISQKIAKTDQYSFLKTPSSYAVKNIEDIPGMIQLSERLKNYRSKHRFSSYKNALWTSHAMSDKLITDFFWKRTLKIVVLVNSNSVELSISLKQQGFFFNFCFCFQIRSKISPNKFTPTTNWFVCNQLTEVQVATLLSYLGQEIDATRQTVE